MRNLKITFFLDGTGVIVNPADPLHLDGLLSFCAMPADKIKMVDRNSNDIFHPELPLAKWTHSGQWGWKASALFPEPERHPESIQYWRKKFRQNRMHIISGSVNLMSGMYREYNMPMPLSLCLRMVAYAVGDRKHVSELLGKLKYLGKKTAYGKGRINNITVKTINDDFAIEKNGKYMRYFPDENGSRFGRVKAPYWNTTGRCQTCYVGDTAR